MQAWKRLCHCRSMTSTITLCLYSSPHNNQTLPQIIHILHFCLVDLLLNYARKFRSQLDGGHDCYKSVLMSAWRLASLSLASHGHFRLRSRCVIRTTEDQERPVCLNIWHVKNWVRGRLCWLTVSCCNRCSADTLSSTVRTLACHCQCQYPRSVLHCFRSIPPFIQFIFNVYLKIQPVTRVRISFKMRSTVTIPKTRLQLLYIFFNSMVSQSNV